MDVSGIEYHEIHTCKIQDCGVENRDVMACVFSTGYSDRTGADECSHVHFTQDQALNTHLHA